MTKEEKRKRGMFFPTRQQKRRKLRLLTKAALKQHFGPVMATFRKEHKHRKHDLKMSMFSRNVVNNRKTRRHLARELAKRSLT